MSVQTCYATQANYEHCKYSTNCGWCHTSRYAELFGTPERAARTLSEHDTSCRDCLLGAYCGEECLTEEEPKLLEWLRGDA